MFPGDFLSLSVNLAKLFPWILQVFKCIPFRMSHRISDKWFTQKEFPCKRFCIKYQSYSYFPIRWHLKRWQTTDIHVLLGYRSVLTQVKTKKNSDLRHHIWKKLWSFELLLWAILLTTMGLNYTVGKNQVSGVRKGLHTPIPSGYKYSHNGEPMWYLLLLL